MNEYTYELVKRSNSIKELAYSPYSKFKVGACILTNTGNIYAGCNVEFCAYGATLCAEASAIATMISSGDKLIAEVAVTSSNSEICYPCGICLQMLSEFSDDSTTVHLCVSNVIKLSLNIRQLLPHAFNKGMLIS